MLIGAIVAEWSLAEGLLAWIYGLLICGAQSDSTAEKNPCLRLAMASFEKVQSFNQKRSMIVVAASGRGFDNATTDKLGKLLRGLQDESKQRITAAHGRWAISPTFPKAVIWVRDIMDPSTALVYELADFDKDLTEITSANEALHDFFWKEIQPNLKF